MAYCKSCGNQLPDNAMSCPFCGAPTSLSTQLATNSTFNNQAGTGGDSFKGTDHTAEYDREDIEKNKAICALAYFPILFFLPLVACPTSRVGKFHANQGLTLLILSVGISVASSVLGGLSFFPGLGLIFNILMWLLSTAGSLGTLALMIIGIVRTVNGQVRDLPIVGGRLTLIK